MSSSPTPAPGYGFELHSHKDPFVIPTVAAVFIFILLVLILWVLTLLFLKRFFCADGGATFSTNQVQRVHLNEVIFQDPSMQFHSHGPESSIMHSAPITQFKKKNGEESRPSNNECAVCLGEFQDGEWLKQLPNCTHVFHIACIDTWLQSQSNCPLCRSNVFNLSLDHEYSVSMHTLLDAPRGEDFFQERAARYQVLRLEILQNLAL